MNASPGFPNWSQLVGDILDKMGKKVHENDKISVFWVKTVERGYKLNSEGR